MKKDLVDFVIKCLTYQQVKVEHQMSVGTLLSLVVPEWKWDKISMNLRYMKSMKILVMDWLSAHHAVLECFNKVVKLSISSKPMMRYHGDCNVVSPCLISALTARRLLAKGCQEILAYVLDNKKKVPVLEEISVVKDFFDVFLRGRIVKPSSL